jgi:hypothetical protein
VKQDAGDDRNVAGIHVVEGPTVLRHLVALVAPPPTNDVDLVGFGERIGYVIEKRRPDRRREVAVVDDQRRPLIVLMHGSDLECVGNKV